MRSRNKVLERILAISAGVLAMAFLIQVAGRIDGQSAGGTYYMAAWQFSPKNLADLHQAADHVVVGQVVSIRRAADIVTQHPGEEGGADRIPTEIVSLKTEKTVKGSAAQVVEVFRTGLSMDPETQQPPPPGAAPPKPQNAVPRPARLPMPTAEQAARYMVHDDPHYQVGQRYLLFLTAGPHFAQGAMRVVSPEGRFFVGADNKLVPVSNRGIAPQFRGHLLDQMHNDLMKLQGPIQRRPDLQFQPGTQGAPQKGIEVQPRPGGVQGVPTR